MNIIDLQISGSRLGLWRDGKVEYPERLSLYCRGIPASDLSDQQGVRKGK